MRVMNLMAISIKENWRKSSRERPSLKRTLVKIILLLGEIKVVMSYKNLKKWRVKKKSYSLSGRMKKSKSKDLN